MNSYIDAPIRFRTAQKTVELSDNTGVAPFTKFVATTSQIQSEERLVSMWAYQMSGAPCPVSLYSDGRIMIVSNTSPVTLVEEFVKI